MIYYFIVSLISYLFYFNIKSKRVMHMFQQNRYHFDSYTNWLKSNFFSIFLTWDLIFLLFPMFMFISYKLSVLIFFVIYLIMYFGYKLSFNKESKQPLVYTARVKRMFFTLYLLLFILLFVILLVFD